MAKDPEQLNLFAGGGPVHWEEATVEAQEAKEAETPAQKKERRQEENLAIVLAHMREVGHPVSDFEVSEAMRVAKRDIKPEQVRAAFKVLRGYGAIARADERDGVALAPFSGDRYTPR